MTESQRDTLAAGPYRRQPPTIDVVPEPAATTPETPDAVPETAIEPIAATGLDPAPNHAEAPAEPASLHHAHLDASGSPVEEAPASTLPAAEPVVDATSEPAGAVTPGEGRPSQTVPPLGGSRAADPVPTPRRTGFGALATTGLLGGLIGAGLVAGAEFYLHPPAGNVDARLAGLESRPRPTPAPDLAPLDRRLGALETQSKDLGVKVAAASALVADAKPAPAAPIDPALRPDLTALGSRVDALEASAKTAATPEVLNEIRTRLDALGTSGEERLRAGAAAITALQATTTALDGRVKAQGDEIGRLPPALMAAGLRAIVAEVVGDDLRAGTPLRPTLTALERLEAGAANLDALRPYADKPAPSAAALAAEFRPIADRITATPAGANVSLGDRLLRMADKIVSVRAVGDGSGNDLPGLVGRIEASLNRGDLPAAAAAADRLPDPARKDAGEWIGRLKARVAADAAAARIKADALAALDKSSR